MAERSLEGNCMLPIREIFLSPKSFEFMRNGKPIVATRREITNGPVRLVKVTIADAMAPSEFRPIRVHNGEFDFFTYQWDHPEGPINVCLAIVPAELNVGRIVELKIRQNFAPHVPGIPVDSGEVIVESGSVSHTIEAGLGDGYYPIFAAKPIFGRPTALVVDFKLWQTNDNVILLPGQRFDEFGMIIDERQAE